jgi:hypothetical protein
MSPNPGNGFRIMCMSLGAPRESQGRNRIEDDPASRFDAVFGEPTNNFPFGTRKNPLLSGQQSHDGEYGRNPSGPGRSGVSDIIPPNPSLDLPSTFPLFSLCFPSVFPLLSLCFPSFFPFPSLPFSHAKKHCRRDPERQGGDPSSESFEK